VLIINSVVMIIVIAVVATMNHHQPNKLYIHIDIFIYRSLKRSDQLISNSIA